MNFVIPPKSSYNYTCKAGEVSGMKTRKHISFKQPKITCKLGNDSLKLICLTNDFAITRRNETVTIIHYLNVKCVSHRNYTD